MSAGLRQEPLVAVVTPVHDGEAYLRRCMESVLRQTYQNWIYLVADNASRDRTRAIAEQVAARDDRIFLHAYTEFVGMGRSWDRALELVPDRAVFVKQLNADDVLLPECLARMVAAAERHPRAAIVSGRRYAGGMLRPEGAPDDLVVVPGHEVARAVLCRGVNYLGTPSLPLLRRELIVGWPRIFDPAPFPPDHPREPAFAQGDRDAYLRTLEKHDLVWVPRALIDQRIDDPASETGYAQRVGAWHPARIELLLRHGEHFLSPSELGRALRAAVMRAVASVVRRASNRGGWRDAEFLEYQRLALSHLGRRLRAAGRRVEAAVLETVAGLLRRAAARA